MAQAAYFRLEHSAVNRARQGWGYLAAHANYAANQRKCTQIIHVNGADNRHAIQNLIAAHEYSLTRKNARVADKILLSLPIELAEDHRHEAVRRFLRSITFDGRTRAIAFYHSDHAHNPHAHVILLDRDVQTGLPVAMMGANRQNRLKAGLEANATEWLRMTWEADCNSVFSDFDYALEVDRRSNLERGLEEAGEHRGWQAENDNAEDVAPPDAPIKTDESDLQPDNVADDIDEAEQGEEEMAYVAEGGLKPEKMTTAERIQVARMAAQEARAVQAAIERKAHALQRYESAKVVAMRAAQAHGSQSIVTQAAEQKEYQARAAYQATHTPDGKAKGFRLSLFGRTLWQSEARRQAEQAARSFSSAQYTAEFARKDLDASAHQSQAEAKRAQELFAEAEKQVQYLQTVYGTDQEAQEAMDAYRESVHKHLDGISMNEIVVMVEEGEITAGEAVEALQLMGRDHDAEELAEHEFNRQKDRGPEM